MIDFEKAQAVLGLFRAKGLTLGAVESLTGGLFSASLCAIPGASAVFKGSAVTYWPEIKTLLIGVEEEAIAHFGVVSEEVANEMASKGREKLDVDVCVSFTGNAGPTAQEGEAPVGCVFMSVATKEKTTAFRHDFAATRNEVREESVMAMFEHLEDIFGK